MVGYAGHRHDSCPEWDGVRGLEISSLYSEWYVAYELFISGLFHLIFLDHGWPKVTETVESETMVKGDLLYLNLIRFSFSTFISFNENNFFFFSFKIIVSLLSLKSLWRVWWGYAVLPLFPTVIL